VVALTVPKPLKSAPDPKVMPAVLVKGERYKERSRRPGPDGDCERVQRFGPEDRRYGDGDFDRDQQRSVIPASGPFATLLFPAIPVAPPCSLLREETFELLTAQ
jgi:hypothetical protein